MASVLDIPVLIPAITSLSKGTDSKVFLQWKLNTRPPFQNIHSLGDELN